jgi:hypothetical protein
MKIVLNLYRQKFEVSIRVGWKRNYTKIDVLLLKRPTTGHFHHTVKIGVSFRHSLRHRNSASTSVVSTLKSVCLSGKTTLISVKTTLLSVKTTLTLSYRVLEMTLLSAEIKSHSKVSKRHSKSHFQHSIR